MNGHAHAHLHIELKQKIKHLIYVMTTQKRQDRKILNFEPQVFTEKSAGGLRFRRERCWVTCPSS